MKRDITAVMSLFECLSVSLCNILLIKKTGGEASEGVAAAFILKEKQKDSTNNENKQKRDTKGKKIII